MHREVRERPLTPAVLVELCPRRSGEPAAGGIVRNRPWVVVTEPDTGEQCRRIADEPDVIAVVRRPRLPGDRALDAKISDRTAGAIVHYRAQHRRDLVCVAWIQ